MREHRSVVADGGNFVYWFGGLMQYACVQVVDYDERARAHTHWGLGLMRTNEDAYKHIRYTQFIHSMRYMGSSYSNNSKIHIPAYS